MSDMSDTTELEETEEKEILRQFVSHNLDYKALVQQSDKMGKFEIAVYQWTAAAEVDIDGDIHEENFLWERIAGPFILDTYLEAEIQAQEQLALLAGESRDDTIPEEMILWLQEYSGDSEAEFLDAANYKLHFVSQERASGAKSKQYTASKVVVVHDLYIVEVDTVWKFGALQKNGVIDCWNEFASLKDAIDSLQ